MMAEREHALGRLRSAHELMRRSEALSRARLVAYKRISNRMAFLLAATPKSKIDTLLDAIELCAERDGAWRDDLPACREYLELSRAVDRLDAEALPLLHAALDGLGETGGGSS